jgi:hypothetical protein
MKRLLLVLFSLVFIASTYAAAPNIEESNRIEFTSESQTTTTPFSVDSIHWTSASGAEIAATGGFILNDANGVEIAACEATALTDYCHIDVGGITVTGFQLEHLDGGHIFVYGKRK